MDRDRCIAALQKEQMRRQKKMLKIFMNINKSTYFHQHKSSLIFNCCMKKLIIFLNFLFVYSITFGQNDKTTISIIPEPVSLVNNAGYFVLPKNINIEIPSNPELKEATSMLKERLSVPTGYTVVINNKTAAPVYSIGIKQNSG